MVFAGDAMGLLMLGLLNPAEGIQLYPVPPEAFKAILSPAQIVPSGPALAMMDGVMITVTESIPVHPLASEAITVYVIVVVGATAMEEVVCPLLQL